jgi:hypothetical protein
MPQLRRSIADFPPRQPGFDPRSGYEGFMVDKVALGQVFSEYFGFPCQSAFHRLLHNHHRSSGAGTIGQQWPTNQVDSVSPHPEKLKKKLLYAVIFVVSVSCTVTMFLVSQIRIILYYQFFTCAFHHHPFISMWGRLKMMLISQMTWSRTLQQQDTNSTSSDKVWNANELIHLSFPLRERAIPFS